jgi:ribosome-binding protein aMBF1 (putative translation factor)
MAEKRRGGSNAPLNVDDVLERDPTLRAAANAAQVSAAVGRMMRRARLRAGLSQAQLADRMGATQAHVSELERGLGHNGPTAATLARTMDVLARAGGWYNGS